GTPMVWVRGFPDAAAGCPGCPPAPAAAPTVCAESHPDGQLVVVRRMPELAHVVSDKRLVTALSRLAMVCGAGGHPREVCCARATPRRSQSRCRSDPAHRRSAAQL